MFMPPMAMSTTIITTPNRFRPEHGTHIGISIILSRMFIPTIRMRIIGIPIERVMIELGN